MLDRIFSTIIFLTVHSSAALKLNGEPHPILVQKVQHPQGECWKHIQIDEENEITGDMSRYEH